MTGKAFKIIITTSLVLSVILILMAVCSLYVYNSVYFFKTTTTLEKSNFTVFHKEFDEGTKNWLIGVVDEDNSMVGSFSCPPSTIRFKSRFDSCFLTIVCYNDLLNS